VGLLDLKLETGDLATLLDVRPTFTLADLCHNAARLDRVMFERSLVKHEAGIHVLAPPHLIHDAGQVRPDGVSLAVSLAKASFPFVLAEVDHTFHEEQMVVLRQVDEIMVVFRLDFVSLRNVRRTVEHLEALGLEREKIRLVVNRWGQPQEVPRAKAEEALGMKISHLLPEDAKTVNRSNNQGVPVVISAPYSKVGKSLATLAKSLGSGSAP
jgi:pilus assembly protein CpaE